MAGVNGMDEVGREGAALSHTLDRALVCLMHQNDTLQERLYVCLGLHSESICDPSVITFCSICNVLHVVDSSHASAIEPSKLWLADQAYQQDRSGVVASKYPVQAFAEPVQ